MEKTVINTCISPWALGKGACVGTKGGAGGALGRGNVYGSDRCGGWGSHYMAEWDAASHLASSCRKRKHGRFGSNSSACFLPLIWLLDCITSTATDVRPASTFSLTLRRLVWPISCGTGAQILFLSENNCKMLNVCVGFLCGKSKTHTADLLVELGECALASHAKNWFASCRFLLVKVSKLKKKTKKKNSNNNWTPVDHKCAESAF